MKAKFSDILFLSLIVIVSACETPNSGESLDQQKYDPAFMYASDNGRIRYLQISDEPDGFSYAVTSYPHGQVGQYQNDFGIIDTSFHDNAYDWSPFNENEDPFVALSLIRDNPEHNADKGQQFEFIYQIAVVNKSKGTTPLYLNSTFREEQVQLEYPTYNKGHKARSVTFADHNTLLVYYTDFNTDYEEDYFNRGYVLRYSLESPNPYVGEVIANFSISGILGTDPPSSHTLHGPKFTRISPSANGKYYYVWTEIPRWGKDATPFVFNSDGTLALDPTHHMDRDYRNPDGFHIAYLEPHPLNDELIVSADVSSPYSYASEHNAIHLLRMPNNPDEWFTTVKTLDWQQVYFEGPEYVDPRKTRDQDNIYLKYHPDGEKVAIAHAIEGTTPSPGITVWSTQGDSTDYYVLPELEGYEFDTIGEPDWLYTHKNLLYFMAGDSDRDEAFLFYVDISQDAPASEPVTAERIGWDSERMNYYDVGLPGEGVSSVRDLKGRELRF